MPYFFIVFTQLHLSVISPLTRHLPLDNFPKLKQLPPTRQFLVTAFTLLAAKTLL